MAARTDAAARSSYYFCTLLVVLCFIPHSLCTFKYSRDELLQLSGDYRLSVEYLIPPEIVKPPSGTPAAADRRRKRCERRQKRGKRGGVWARLKASPFKPPLPTIFLSNARSIRHKLDEIRLQIATRRTLNHCSCLIFSETWLDNSIPDAAIELAGRTAYRADRTAESEAELLLLKCRPFYLPREFAVVYICAVYIPPDANAKLALAQVSSSINNSLVAHPDSVFIAAGDFNHADLKSVLHKFHRNVKCATRGDRTLDQVYTNVAGAYRAQAYPHLGLSDHLSLLLHPRYTPKIKSAGITVKTVRTWPEDAVPMLQDCFHHTDWDVFKEQNTDKRVVLDNYTSTVLDYICFCVDNVTCWRQFRVFPNTPPWMTQEVKQLIRARDTAFHSGDQEAYSAARADLRRGINTAKRHYRRRIEARFETTTNPRQVWEGIRAITDYKRRSPPSSADSPTLAEDLNLFYARFDRDNTDPVLPPLPTTGLAPVLSVHEVRRVFCSINTRKAAGPDGVLGRVLKDCAAELADVFTSIFNISLSCSLVPACFKAATIVPLPKQPNVTCLNDFRPVALTSIPAKCLERLVIKHIKAALPLSLDPHQFAYRENRSTEDAIATVLHTLLEHLEHKNTYARLLFVDYSSAFNTIRPYKLRPKLHQLGLNTTLCNWIVDFLTNRTQSVRVGKNISSTLVVNTGAPQGCVLSPLLYTLYTHDCLASSASNLIVKFADDTTVLGLITNNDEANYRREVQHLESWCHNNNLVLNTKKTKEIVVDFRRRGHTDHQPLFIGKDVVERVQSFKFLGVTVTEDLSWGDHISKAVGKAQQRLYYLRKLKSAHISRPLMVNFYNCAISSVLTYGFLVWFSSCSKADQQALQRVVKAAGRIIGTTLPEISTIFSTRCLRRVHNILRDQHHPAHHLFHLLPSGRRYRSIQARTSRLANSLYPQAVRLLNSAPLTSLPPSHGQ
ncbi:hypothetical protein WMY93_018377 [Mugilogobius chulae]|uniref:Reverse transcriptase domain-containing protein n=1 Tax=Mugilogobius chulae TaxID=88201 RepID=A0AAW0NJU4_9GOBI